MLRSLFIAVLLLASAARAQIPASAPDAFAFPDISQIQPGCSPSAGAWACNGPYNDTGAKALRSSQTLNTGITNLVLILAGQSNREAEAPTAYTVTNASAVDNFNFSNGALYAYSDPPLGSSYQFNSVSGGGIGSIGGRIADKFVTGGQFAHVVVVPVAVGGTQVANWATGPLSKRLCQTMGRLKARGIVAGTNVTIAIEWGQGEADAGTSQAAYTTSLNTVISNVQSCGFTGRFFVAVETWQGGSVTAGVQAAQAAVVNGTTVFASGNIDSLNAANRVADNIHLNDTGIAAAATLIYNAMHASGAPFLYQPPFAANDNWQALDGCNDNTRDLCKAM